MNKYLWYAVAWLALAGAFNATMGFQMFYRERSWMYAAFDWLGASDWFLGVGGNKVWRMGVIVVDGWHTFKNLMWLCVGIACTHLLWQEPVQWWMRLIFGMMFGLCITITFIIFFHIVYGA